MKSSEKYISKGKFSKKLILGKEIKTFLRISNH
jgi:hypothetical protein